MTSEEIAELFDKLPSPFVLLDRDLRLVWCNEAYAEVTGRVREHIIGRIMTEEFPADPDSVSDKMLRASFRRVFDSGETDHLPLIPYPIAEADGTIRQRYWSATHTPIKGEDGEVRYILQNTNDVTDLYEGQPGGGRDAVQQNEILMRAEAVAQLNLELDSTTDFFQRAFDQAPSFIAVTFGPDHVIRICNKAYLNVTGNRSLVGKSLRDAFPEVEGQGYFELIDDAYATATPRDVRAAPVMLRRGPDAELEEVFVDFVYQPLLNSDGNCIGIITLGHEVTAQVLAERDLRRAEKRFRELAQNMPAHVWTAEADGGLDWVSAQVENYSGVPTDRLLGAEWASIVHPEDIERVAPLWARAVQDGSTYEAEFRLRRHDGSYRWHLVRATPIRNSEGEIERWVGTNADIHDRVRAEEALAELNETLEERVQRRNRELEEVHASLRQSQKMEAIGNLAGGIAHDFNNMLQTIGGSLQLARRTVEDEGQAAERIDLAMQAVRSAAKLASQLLSFGRRQALEPRPLDLCRQLEELKPMIQTGVGDGIEVGIEAAPDLWATLVDPTDFENAIINLAVNARDAMNGEGRLTLALDNATLPAKGAGLDPGDHAGDYVRVRVKDTGSGMPRETLEHVFEPFFTTKLAGKGTGLGLAMVYGFVKQSGGRVEIESTPGQGTTVTLALPRSTAPVEEARKAMAVGAARGDETILLVDDDAEVRRSTRALLEDLGYSLREAANGRAALHDLEVHGPVDLVLSDVVMPGGMSGRDLAVEIARRWPELPLLFTSGYAQDFIERENRLADDVHVLRKPYTQEALAAAVRDAIDARNGAPASAEGAAGAAPTVASGDGLRVLVCEDEPLILFDLIDTLTAQGFSVEGAGTGTQALGFLQRDPFDVLITDVGLPDMSGLELAQAARDMAAALPIVFATGKPDVPGAEALGGAVGLVRKPFLEEDILSEIARVRRDGSP